MKRLILLLAGGFLVLSLALDIFLWSRLSGQSNQLRSAQASASEIDELRRQNQELQMNQTSASDSASANARELARLRNEVGQRVARICVWATGFGGVKASSTSMTES